MQPIRYYELYEDGGWIHELLVDTGHGFVQIIDDTGDLEITASTTDVTLVEARNLWHKHHIGGSDFPYDIGDATRTNRRADGLDFALWIGGSESMCAAAK